MPVTDHSCTVTVQSSLAHKSPGFQQRSGLNENISNWIVSEHHTILAFFFPPFSFYLSFYRHPHQQ